MLQRTRLVSSEPLVANVSSNGAFLGEGSRDRCACSRLAVPAYRLLDSKSSGRTIPSLRPTSSTKSRGLQFCTTHTLQSHSFMRDCRDCIFGPQMSPSAMYRPYIALIATPAISWRPRPSLVRPRAVPSTPGHALHAGGVGLTRLDRGEKATFWWPRCAAGVVPRLLPKARFPCRRRCAILGPPPALECLPWRF